MNATRQNCTRASWRACWRNISVTAQRRDGYISRDRQRNGSGRGSSAPVYQQAQQPQPPQLHNGGSNSFPTGVSGGAGGPDMGQSVTLNSGVTARNEMTDAAFSVSANGNRTGNYVLGHPADFTFGVQG